MIGDTDRRTASHLEGKQHQGYFLIRSTLDEKLKVSNNYQPVKHISHHLLIRRLRTESAKRIGFVTPATGTTVAGIGTAVDGTIETIETTTVIEIDTGTATAIKAGTETETEMSETGITAVGATVAEAVMAIGIGTDTETEMTGEIENETLESTETEAAESARGTLTMRPKDDLREAHRPPTTQARPTKRSRARMAVGIKKRLRKS